MKIAGFGLFIRLSITEICLYAYMYICIFTP